jgi:stress response protein YsnF
MTSDSTLPPVIGAIADDRDGRALGTVTAVFLDDVTQRPTWVGLTEGLHAATGDVPVIAPITGAEFDGGRLRLTVSGDAVRSAPRVAEADRLTPAEEATLLEHYRTAAPARRTTTDPTAGTTTDPTAGTTAGTAADPAMTRSEEQLQVSTVVEPWTRAVLRIEEVTEEVMVPVTITRQQARIEYLPLSTTEGVGAGGQAAAPGTERPTSASEWVTLYADQPSVTLARVPVERVRLRTSWATEETTVSQELRKEQVELTTTEIPRS